MPRTQSETIEAAQRLIRAATGEEYGDGMMVSGLGVGYAEPGYHDDDTVWVLGNWNSTGTAWQDQREGRKPALADTVPPRLGDALTRLGVEIEWSDEWAECGECYRIVRTSGDSYGWTPSFVMTDGQITCHECVLPNLEDYLGGNNGGRTWGNSDDSYINNPRHAITFCAPSDVEALGFVKWEPGNPQDYESGWYPGQNDDPEKILSSVLELHPAAEVVFFIDSVGQFDIHFSAYVRGLDTETATGDDEDLGPEDHDEYAAYAWGKSSDATVEA